ncbi:hypothetical protein MKCMC460_62110 (plasmid) [Mycobacterium sp. 20KCMC460]|nr:hypothetical protein MKCMC460_62110 [Mycobacterium sp. 20KCMC460]
MSKRISPAQRLQAEIDEVFAGGEDLAGAIEQVAVLGARLLLQAAIEAEVTAFLGRDRYERAAGSAGARAGMRNGYCPTTVKTTAGPVTLERPKVRGTAERFASQLFGKGVTKTNALESLVIAGFVRGLSTRDVQATLTEALGETAAVSKSTVSRICEDIRDQFEAWSARSARRHRAGLPVPRRQPLQIPRQRVGRPGAGRVGYRHRRQPGVRRAGGRFKRVR